MISHEIAKFTGIGCKRDFCEMLNIVFEREFPVNVNSLTHHYHQHMESDVALDTETF